MTCTIQLHSEFKKKFIYNVLKSTPCFHKLAFQLAFKKSLRFIKDSCQIVKFVFYVMNAV